MPGASVEDLLSAPFVWIGTVEEIREKLDEHRISLGVDRYIVRAPAVSQVRDIIMTTP